MFYLMEICRSLLIWNVSNIPQIYLFRHCLKEPKGKKYSYHPQSFTPMLLCITEVIHQPINKTLAFLWKIPQGFGVSKLQSYTHPQSLNNLKWSYFLASVHSCIICMYMYVSSTFIMNTPQLCIRIQFNHIKKSAASFCTAVKAMKIVPFGNVATTWVMF